MLLNSAPGGAVRIALERVTGIRVSAARIRTASLRSVREAPPEPRALNRVRFPSPIRMLWKTAPGGAVRIALERVTGIEPAWSAWKAEVLPLNYTRIWSG